MGVYWTRRSDPGRSQRGVLTGRRRERLVLRRTGPRAGSDAQLYSVLVGEEPDWDRVAEVCRDGAELRQARERYAVRAAAEELDRIRLRVSVLPIFAADISGGVELCELLPEDERDEARAVIREAVRAAAVSWGLLRPRAVPPGTRRSAPASKAPAARAARAATPPGPGPTKKNRTKTSTPSAGQRRARTDPQQATKTHQAPPPVSPAPRRPRPARA